MLRTGFNQGTESSMFKLQEPEKAGVCSQRIARLSTWLNLQVDEKRIAGGSLYVERKGSGVFFDAAGLAQQRQQRPFGFDTVVRIYSMTKPITTVAAMMLYEQGLFELDDPVAKFLPEFEHTRVWDGGKAGGTVAANSPITVRQLMTHTSGLTYNFMNANPVDAMYRERRLDFLSHARTLAEHSVEAAASPLIFHPGEAWGYSIATDILGRLVEVLAQEDLRSFFIGRIFRPLGMLNTDFHVHEDCVGRFSDLYAPLSGANMSSVASSGASRETREPGIKLVEVAEQSRFLEPAVSYSGGGGLVGTIEDYAQFCRMLLNGGELSGSRLLGTKTVDYMRRNHLPDGKDMAGMGQPVWSETTYAGIGFGLGFAVVVNPVEAQMLTSVGEHHWGGAASTHFWIDPQEELFVIFFTQLMPSSAYPFRRQLRSQIYSSLIA